MNRRSFMQSILAAGVAPWVVTTAGVLMPVRQIHRQIGIYRTSFATGWIDQNDYSLQVTLPAIRFGKYIVKHERGGVLRIYPNDILMVPGETRTFTL